MQTHHFGAAALLILVSELFLVVSGMVVKQLDGALPVEQIVFFRNLFGLALLTPWLLRNGRSAIRTTQLRFHFIRAAVGVTAMSCLYYSWQNLPLAQAALLKQTAPFFMPLIAFWWLGEKMPSKAKWSILIGFIGVYLILNPSSGTLNVAVLIALIGAMLGAMLGATAKVVIRRMSGSESPQRIVFYFAFFSTLIAAVPATINWVNPGLSDLVWLGAMAATSTIAQLLLSKAYGMAPAGQLGPFTYASVGFAALFGWLLWEEVLGLNSLAGMALIIGAGFIALQANTVSRRSA